jgi:hypothetical protein
VRALAAKSVNRMTLKTVRMPQKGISTSPYSQRVRCRRLRAFPKEGISGWNRSCRFFTKGGGTQPRSGSNECGKPEMASILRFGRQRCQRQAVHPGDEANTLIASASAAEAGLGVVKRRVP